RLCTLLVQCLGAVQLRRPVTSYDGQRSLLVVEHVKHNIQSRCAKQVPDSFRGRKQIDVSVMRPNGSPNRNKLAQTRTVEVIDLFEIEDQESASLFQQRANLVMQGLVLDPTPTRHVPD